jgi:hypothetical protein
MFEVWRFKMTSARQMIDSAIKREKDKKELFTNGLAILEGMGDTPSDLDIWFSVDCSSILVETNGELGLRHARETMRKIDPNWTDRIVTVKTDESKIRVTYCYTGNIPELHLVSFWIYFPSEGSLPYGIVGKDCHFEEVVERYKVLVCKRPEAENAE